MLKQCGKWCNKKPEDFVISTGKQYSVKEFVNTAAKYLGINIKWVGKELMKKE